MFFSFFMPFEDALINQHPGDGDRDRHAEDDGGASVLAGAQRVAAESGGNDGRDAPDRADQQPQAEGDVRESGKVGKKILRRSGNGEDQSVDYDEALAKQYAERIVRQIAQ